MRSHARAARAIAITILLALPFGAAAQDLPSLTVTGEGSVSAVPDMATVTLGVSARDPSAATAMNRTSQAVAAILERLTALGVAPRDVQTTDLSLGPVWVDRNNNGQPQVDGFEASNRVTVRIRAIDSVGAVLEAVLEDGANRLDGLSFGLQDPRPLLDEARRLAVADARAKAQLYADAAGVPLGPVRELTEGGVIGPRPEMMMAMRADAVPVAAGETTLSALVTVVYDIGERE